MLEDFGWEETDTWMTMVAGASCQGDFLWVQSEKFTKLLSTKGDKVQTLYALCMLHSTQGMKRNGHSEGTVGGKQ